MTGTNLALLCRQEKPSPYLHEEITDMINVSTSVHKTLCIDGTFPNMSIYVVCATIVKGIRIYI